MKANNEILKFFNKHKYLIFKIGIFLVLAYILWFQVIKNENSHDTWILFKERLKNQNIFLLFIVLVLMPVNWWMELLKWRVLIKYFTRQSYKNSVKSILAGVTISLFTPNRVGEYAGRIIFVNDRYILRSILASIVGSISQWMTIVGFGLLSISYLSYFKLANEEFVHLYKWIVLGIILLMALAFFYFKISFFEQRAERLLPSNLKKRIVKSIRILRYFRKRDLVKVLLYSMIRFLIYSSQYVILLLFFGLKGNIFIMFLNVIGIFLAQTGLPIPPMAGLFARSELAIMFLVDNKIDEHAVIASTLSLWLINLFIPALFGAIIILLHKQKEKKKLRKG